MTTPEIELIGQGTELPASPEPGILLVDKPGGMTSFAVVKRVRAALGVKKVGHAGTLDPMATGLLIVLLGRAATRCQDAFMALPKTYMATMRLGQTTPSFDAETEVSSTADASMISDSDLQEVMERFTGEILQTPPMYSAVKVGGERLYRKARRGETVEREPRSAVVYRLEMTARRGDDVDMLVECSKGTYVRSLAHDMGQVLGAGAHLVALRRTAIGTYGVNEAWQLDELERKGREMRDEGRRS